MKTLRMLCWAGSFVAAGLLATGCGTPPGDTDGMDASPSMLELENGGMTTANEPVDFNDSKFTGGSLESEDGQVPELGARGGDTILDEEGLLPMEPMSTPDRHIYRAVVLWGYLPRAADDSLTASTTPPATVTDWSGSVSIDSGHLSVRRVIGFEPLTGDRVMARTDPRTASFVSRTRPFVDGLAMVIRVVGAPGMLHLRTAAGTFDFDLADARDFEARYLSDGKNAVRIAFYEVTPTCRAGILLGHWRRLARQFGVFRGRVYADFTGPAGAVRGIWGRNRAGNTLFIGKHISNTGVWNGFLVGHYGYRLVDDVRTDVPGYLEGLWGVRSSTETVGGALAGRYFDGLERGDGHGIFLGRWVAAGCH